MNGIKVSKNESKAGSSFKAEGSTVILVCSIQVLVDQGTYGRPCYHIVAPVLLQVAHDRPVGKHYSKDKPIVPVPTR